MNPFSFRFYVQNTPLEALSQGQRLALEKFLSKLAQGAYHFEDVPCLCGRWDGKLIAQRDRYALPVKTHLCRSCGTMWTSPRMTEDSLTKFYECDYRPIYAGAQKATDDFFAEQVRRGCNIYQFISSDIECVQHPVVFDVGCGAGGALIPFIEASWSAFGCDLGTEFLEFGVESGLNLVQGDVLALKEHGPANLVILSHVLEHLHDPLKSLKQIFESLTADGYVYVELPGVLRIHKAYGDIMLFLQNAHLYHFTLTTLSSLMSMAGFRLIKGNENICALFQKDCAAPTVSTEGEYQRVLTYLYFAEFWRICHLNYFIYFIHHTRQLAVKLIRRIFGERRVNDLKNRLGWPQL